MPTELGRVIDQVEKDKGISRSVIIEALESALLSAAKKKYGIDAAIEAHFNEDLGEVELFQFKTVVEKVAHPLLEIELNEAHELDPDAALGDSIGMKLGSSEFGRIAAQAAKQVIFQKVRDAERDIIFKEFNIRKGEVVSGICRRVEKGCVIVDLGRTDAIMPAREQIPGESFRPGDRVLGYLIDVQQTLRGPKIVLSRCCPELLMQLFKQEVPEISEGIVQIKGAAREPGARAKIAVVSNDNEVDPVGACVGIRGSRVQNVVQELRGEKIDIVPWEADETRFVCNALAPAEVLKVRIDEDRRTMEIVVAENQLSLAIGKKGQNVKLASQLTGWRLDILSESKMALRTEEAKALLALIPGMNDTLAEALYQFGYSVEQIAAAETNALLEIPGLTSEKAEEIKVGAAEALKSGKVEAVRKEWAQKLQQSMAAAATSRKSASDVVFDKLRAEVKAHEERKKNQESEPEQLETKNGTASQPQSTSSDETPQ